ncbi:primosomal protein [Acinetobacter phage phiAC-1]|uniref:primosomal protein n=1 Tax=Acinetobacter phage phiAC-1 TaxID=1229760 RepID=UPI00028B42BF|nr:primosomal protein [Acinetobacter phage phiAC-1]AFU62255.1 hypothetical protein phiAC-1_0006 [Acinetobacter phage phiAC-1]
MHYYTFKPKDYMSKTAFLEPMEDLAYRRMLDHCYLTEKPLPENIDEIAMLIRMRTHTDSIKVVLHYFFELTAQGYVNDYVARELSAYHSKSLKAKASADARWSKERKKIKDITDDKSQCDIDANALRKECESNANQQPITNNDKPITSINNIGESDKPTRFMFNKELINLGCDKDLVIEYMAHRKAKKASNSKIAFDGLIREQQKSGLDLNAVMKICIERGWRGFEASWLKNQNSGYQQSTPQSRQTPSMADYMQREMMRDVYHEQQNFLEHKE